MTTAVDRYHFAAASADMWTRYGNPLISNGDPSETKELYLRNGLPYKSFEIYGDQPGEGLGHAIVVGHPEQLVASPEGVLTRVHAACSFSEVGIEAAVKLLFPGAWGDIAQNPTKQLAQEHTGRLLYLEAPDSRYVRTLGDTMLGNTVITFGKEWDIDHWKPSKDCDCRQQRLTAQGLIARHGGIYFDLFDRDEQEGRGNGLLNKLKIYMLQLEGLNTYEACDALDIPWEGRAYGHVVHFLLERMFELYGVRTDKVRLLSNNPEKLCAFRQHLEATLLPLNTYPLSEASRKYTYTKIGYANHRRIIDTTNSPVAFPRRFYIP